MCGKRPSAVLVVAAVCCAVGAPAVAHDLWIEAADDWFTLYQGHLYSSHAGEERVAYDPAIVKEARCATVEGTVRSLPRPQASPARFPGPCAALFVQTSSGYWSQTLTGSINKPRDDVSGVLRSWLSEEGVKRIMQWTAKLATPMGGDFELVPSSDPLGLEPGEKIRLLATWRGTPKAGVTVAYDGSPRGLTGSDGRINVRLRHGGTQIISASFEEPLDDPRADKIVRTTILQFQLPE